MHVNDQNIINSLNAIASTDENGWYLFEGKHYAKKVIDFPNYNPGANALLEEGDEIHSKRKYADGFPIVFGNADWFVCESIKWRILKEEDGLMCLLSDMIMNAHQFEAKSNVFESSMIKSYLENEFKVKAFPQPFSGEITLPAKEDLVGPACLIQRDF